MTGVSKEGCVQLAKAANKRVVKDAKRGMWGLVMANRLARDSWMKSARAK